MPQSKSLHASPEDAEQAFYEALENANLEALMELWSDDDEIVCIHPGGPRLVGHAAVRAGWKALFTNGPVLARRAHLHVIGGPMFAVHSIVEQVIVAQAEATTVVNVFATNVYIKGPQGWRLILHHAGLTPPDHALSVGGPVPQLLH